MTGSDEHVPCGCNGTCDCSCHVKWGDCGECCYFRPGHADTSANSDGRSDIRKLLDALPNSMVHAARSISALNPASQLAADLVLWASTVAVYLDLSDGALALPARLCTCDCHDEEGEREHCNHCCDGVNPNRKEQP